MKSDIACEQALRGALAAGREKEGELQLRLWNLNSTSNSPSTKLSGAVPANEREAETSAKVSKHRKTRTKGNDVIINVISANQKKWLQALLPFPIPPPERFGSLDDLDVSIDGLDIFPGNNNKHLSLLNASCLLQ